MTVAGDIFWQRRQIMAFIRAEPIKVELQRPQFAETAAGGKIQGLPAAVSLQTFRLTPFKRRLVNEWGITAQGEEVKKADWVLHGAHDADVEVDDTFVYRQHEYQVIWVSDHNLYRTAAGLVVRGKLGAV